MDKQTHAPGAKPPIGRKERRSAIARRANAVFTSMVVLLAQVLSAVGAVFSLPAVASAAEYGQQISLSEATQAIGRTYTFKTSEGSLAWCGDRHASHPDVGRNGTVCEGKKAQWHGTRNDDTTLTGYTDTQMRMIDYLVFVGNRDITASGSAFGMWGTWPVDEGGSGASKAAVVVQAAIWMVSSYPNPADVTQDGDWSFYAGDCYGDDAGTGVYAQNCILNAYNEAKDYAEGGAGNSNIDGCARVIKFGDDCQDIFFYTAPTGSLTLKKVSGITSITDSNACYDISGAQYGVYRDPSCSDSSLINTLQTDLLGNTGTVTGLSAGTYYVKETKAAPGYKLCTEVHAVNVTSGATATVTCSEPPAYDIVDGDLIGKHDSKIDYKAGANTAQGGSTLKGAQFTIEYYDTVSYDSYDALKKSGTKAKRTWVVETDANGMAKLSAATKVSGDALYTVGGQTVIPRGTVVIRETKAPEGYKLSSDVSFQTVQKTVQNGSSTESFHTIHTGVFSEDDIYGGLAVNKIDHDRDESVPQGDATLEGAEITIKNVSGGRVYVKGKWYDDGADVMTIRTDKNGHATTGTSDLPFGIYECRETKAPTGYLLNSTWRDNISVSKEGEIVESTNDVDDTVIRGGISVEKVDKDTKKSTPQGNASIDGAKIGIINRSEESVRVKGVWYASGAEIENCELTIKDGKAATGAEDLPYGTYELYEKASGEGYKISSDWKQEVKVEKNAETVEVKSKLENEVYRGGVRIVKYDSELGESTPQGDATLAGATFSIQNASDEPVDINGTEYEHGAICLTLDTKAVKLADGRTQYIAECSDILPYGHYRVYETSAAEGYGLNVAWNQEFDITEDGQVVSLIDEELGCDEDVIRGGISVTKADRELNKSTALGAATLAGCHLSVKNVSEGPVKVNDVVYESGQLINGLDLVTDENGNASTDDDALPYGTYEIRESISSQGYELNTEWVKTVEIREHKIYPVGSGDTSNDVLKEQVKRADFALGKVSSKGDRLANVAFLVTSKTTGEAHVIVTQGDGSINSSSSVIKHSKNTNASDAALTNGTLDESKLDSRAGIWFSGSATEQTQVDDRLGALPYDVYTVEELRCSANKGHRLVSTEMTVDDNGAVIKLGDLCDEWVELSTEMTYDNGHTVPQGEKVVLTDVVTYKNLAAKSNYTLRSELHLVNSAHTDMGVIATSEQTFRTGEQNGSIDVVFSLDTSALTDGSYLVAFEEIYDAKGLLKEHKDINDENQTVTVVAPTLSTSAIDVSDGDKNVIADGQASVADTVYYENLAVGTEYTISGVIMNPRTKNTFKDANGNEVRASKTFTAASRNGSVDLLFDFDASGSDDHSSLVLFATLSHGDKIMVQHTDWDDAKELLSLERPKLTTTAVDGLDGDKTVTGEAEVSIVDTVHYENIRPNHKYTLSGTLMNKKTGKAFVDADGKTITATSEFTPESSDGDVKVTFTFNASELTIEDQLVVFEELSADGKFLADHANINDEGQTVTIGKPTVTTSAYDGFDEDSVITGEADAVLIDTVHYEGVTPGKTYKVDGTLMDKKTGEAIKGSDGNAVTASAEFTPTSDSGDVNVTFTFDAGSFNKGDRIVAFETLSYKGVTLATHTDIDDSKQTVSVTKPELSTTASDAADGDKEIVSEPDVSVTDKVHYKGVTPGKTYKVTGTLMNKASGKVVTDVNGNPVTTQKEFTPKGTEGDVEMTFTFDATAFTTDDKLVVFEALSYKGTQLAAHADLNDKGQTVVIVEPALGTEASDGYDGDKDVTGEADASVIDVVHYSNVNVGKTYTVTGTLMDKQTGKAVTDANGKAVTATKTFTAEEKYGDIELTFEFDASEFKAGDKLVAFESMSHKGVEVGVHADLEDEYQTVTITKPELKTTAVDKLDGDKNVIGEADALVVDTVHYKGVTPGKTYKVTGTLMDKQTGEAVIDADGNAVTAEKEFTAQDKEGDVDIEFTFDAGAYKASDKLVAFESISYKGRELATHADLEDEDQTVTITKPELKTTAVDKLDGDKNVIGEADVTVVDTVHYKGVTPGKTYKVTGTLMDKQTGEAVIDADGNAVTAEKEFTAQDKEGDVDIEFTFDAGAYKASDKLVAFESISYKGRELATHADLEDEDQTVTITKPELKTTAVDKLDGDKNVIGEADVTVVDTVHYKGVTPGKTYKVEGVLMEKTTDAEGNVSEEKFLDADGNEAKAEVEFTPEGTEGDIEVTFSFDATGVADGTPLVAFESISHKGRELAVHADITDEDQTVVVEVPEVHTTATDAVDGDKDVTADPTAKVIDAVEYKGLTPGKTYKVEGVLMQKVTDTDGKVFEQEFVAANGDRVTAEAEFTPEKTEGSVELTFEFDASLLSEGEQLVAFEDLIYNGKTIAVHADIKDEAQTVTFHTPKIGTTATDAVDGDKFIVADAESTVDDRVAYEGIVVGQKYTLVGMLMNKETGLPVLTGNGADEFGEDDLKTFMAEVETLFSGYAADDETEGAEPKRAKVDTDVLAEFCDKNAALIDALAYKVTETEFDAVSGSETISISFDGRDLIGEDDEPVDTVVFELLLRGSIADAEKGEGDIYVAAEHADITDEGQTVTISPSSIGTTAVDKADSDKELEPAEKQAITDTVVYKGLIPGKEYKLHATLMDKNTGKELTADGKAVTAELTFTPTDADGQVDIDLGPFDASELGGHTLVVFEELTRAIEADGKAEDTAVAVHKDIDDEKQSVTVKEKPIVPFVPVIPTNHVTLQTGIDSLAVPVAAAMIATAGAGVAIIRKRRRE